MIEGAYKTSSPQTGQERLRLDAVEKGATVHFTAVLCGCLSVSINATPFYFLCVDVIYRFLRPNNKPNFGLICQSITKDHDCF